MSKASQPINDFCALRPQPVHGARQPEPQACKTYTAPSAEYCLHVNILNRRLAFGLFKVEMSAWTS